MENKKTPEYLELANATIERHESLSDNWDHEYGVILKAFTDLWEVTREPKYLKFVEDSVDPLISDSGEIKGYGVHETGLDNVNSGRVLFPLYDETKKEKYKKALDFMIGWLGEYPRTSFGYFLHKENLKDIMFTDSAYMGIAFYAQYGSYFNDEKVLSDAVDQLISAADYTQDKETGLLYEGYNETKTEIWADPETGLSGSFWGRGLGWYAVAVTEILEYLPKDHLKRERLLEIYRDLMKGVVEFQDETGAWWQVVDQGARETNYLEASGSAMFTYSLAKGVRLGYLDKSYKEAALKGYKGLVEQFIERDEEGEIHLVGTCTSGGLGGKDYRDGSFESYSCEATGIDDHKGVGVFIMAGLQVDLLDE